MAIDPSIYRGVDTQYGLKLSDLLNPAAIQQRQASAEAQNMSNQLRQMQVLQGVEQMRRAPVLARREEQMFQAQQAEALRKQQEMEKRQAMIQQLPEEQRRMIELGVSPEKALLPEKPIGIVQELRAAGISETSPEGQRILRERLTAKGAGGGQPYFTPVQTAQGVMSFNARTGRMEPVQISGQTVLGAQYDPRLQGQLAGAKESGKLQGKTQTQAVIDLPQDIQEANNTIQLVDDLLKHPGFGQAVGKSSMAGIQLIPGTEAHDFSVRLDQLKGKQFLQAFQSLKGGGQITEVEGKKATDAISRMNNSQSEGEFVKAANEFKQIIQQGVDRAKKKAGASDDEWSDL